MPPLPQDGLQYPSWFALGQCSRCHRGWFALVRCWGAGENCGVSRNLKNIGIVSAATVVSRVLGLGRDILVTGVFGTSALASAFVTAFTLPNLFRRFLGEGALTAALVPTLKDEEASEGNVGVFALVNQVGSWLGLVTLLLVTGAMLLLHGLADSAWLRQVAANADQAARWSEAARLAVILFPYLVFVCVSAAFSAALQTLGRFLSPALSPIWLNLAMIGMLGGAVWLGEVRVGDARMRWLCAGVLLGGFLQMVVPALDLMRAGWRPRLVLRLSPQVRAVLLLMGPTVVGSAVYLINMAFSRILGLSINESAAAVLNLATRLVELPIGVFAIAVSTVVFPLISGYAASGNWSKLAEAYHKGMRLVLAVNVPAAVGMMVLAGPIVRVLFERGQFAAADTALVVPVLLVFAVGLPFFAYVNLMLRAFYAQKDTRTSVRAAMVSFVVNVVLSLALMGPLSTMGLALASNIAIVVQAVILQTRLTARRAELSSGPWRFDLAKILMASGLMAVVVKGGEAVLATIGEGWGPDLVRLALLLPGGVLVYGIAIWKLRLTGREELLALLRRRRSIESANKTS